MSTALNVSIKFLGKGKSCGGIRQEREPCFLRVSVRGSIFDGAMKKWILSGFLKLTENPLFFCPAG